MDYRNAKTLLDGRIDCEIDHPVYGWIPFTADPDDVGAWFNVAALHAAMAADPKTALCPTPTQGERDAQKAEEMRAERNRRLAAEVDPIAGNALRWADLSDAKRLAWAKYRQALLDVPQQDGFPCNTQWPTKPE